jgi:serine/threonine protein kinase
MEKHSIPEGAIIDKFRIGEKVSDPTCNSEIYSAYWNSPEPRPHGETEFICKLMDGSLPADRRDAEFDANEQLRGIPHIAVGFGYFRGFGSSGFFMRKFNGGDLLEFLLSTGELPLSWICSISRQILQALAHMHSAGWAHLDVKLENIFIEQGRDKSLAPDAYLSDFGFSRCHVEGDDGYFTECLYTPEYCAPELTTEARCCTKSADMWAFGVALYVLTTRRYPFPKARIHPKSSVLRRRFVSAVCRGAFKEGPLAGFDVNLVDLIRQLLNPDPTNRLTAARALDHPFLDLVTEMCHATSGLVPEGPDDIPEM